MAHGSHASGIPYWPGACQKSRNFTYHAAHHHSAIKQWYLWSEPRWYICNWQSGDFHQYMVYTLSTTDAYLAAAFGVQSCAELAYIYGLGSARAFEYGWGNANNDRLKTVIRLNLSAYGFVDPIDNYDDTRQTNIIAHEMGHSLHLQHNNHGVMNPCAGCGWINGKEINVITWIYASPP